MHYAASIDTVPNRDLTIASIGFGMPLGDLRLETAVEVSWGTATKVAGKVQLRGVLGRVKGGLGLYLPGTIGGPKMIEAFASFDPTENSTVAAVVQIPLGHSLYPTMALSAQYAFSPTIGISAGILKDAGNDIACSAFLDWKF